MKKKIEYGAVKKALWEAWRVFIPAFLAVIYAQFEAGVDLKEIRSWGYALLVSALLAGGKAVVKWLREMYGRGDYGKAIYKLPL